MAGTGHLPTLKLLRGMASPFCCLTDQLGLYLTVGSAGFTCLHMVSCNKDGEKSCHRSIYAVDSRLSATGIVVSVSVAA